MFGLFKKKQKQPTINVTATLNARLMPIDRGDVFEDPLDEWLREKNLGEVDGGGCGLSDSGEVEFCDVEIMLFEASEEVLDQVISKLDSLGAAKGSLLRMGESSKPFGKAEGLAIYLNGTDLPADIYANSDVNHLIEEVNKALDGIGFFAGGWDGPVETALYLYGPSYSKMQEALAELLGSYPLCQKCRIVQIA